MRPRSLETVVEKVGCPLYPGSREKSGYVPGAKYGTRFNGDEKRYESIQLCLLGEMV